AAGSCDFYRDFGLAIIADLGRETRYHRHGQLDQFAAALFVCHDATNTFVAESVDHICQQPDRLEKAMRHHWHHHVELEVSIGSGPSNGRVVADHLCADHHY